MNSIDIKDQPRHLYSPLDHDAINKATLDSVHWAVSKSFPVENDKYSLSVEDLGYDGPVKSSPKAEKEAVLTGNDYSVKLKGRWVLKDKATGKVVDKSGRLTLMRVPIRTRRGTYIRSGFDNMLLHVLRLSPGIYVVRSAVGETKAQINPIPGTGAPMALKMSPETGVFTVDHGYAKPKLYSVLRAAGIPDADIERELGRDLYVANKRAAARFVKESAPRTDHAVAVLDELASARFDPDVMERVLKRKGAAADANTLLGVAKKMVGVARGEIDPDKRDELYNQRVAGPPELLSERVLRDAGGIVKRLLWKATNKGSLESVGSGALQPHVDGAFNLSRLDRYVMGASPIETADLSTKLTRLGEGGLGSTKVVTKETRNVLPSYLGYIDPLRTPESINVGLDSFMAQNTYKASDGSLVTRLKDAKTGKYVMVPSRKAAKMVVATADAWNSGSKSVPVPGTGGIKLVDRNKVDYIVENPDDAYSPIAHTVPFKSGVTGMRLNMGAKFSTQALPLVNRESPLVRSFSPDGAVDYEREYGDLAGNVRSKAPGKVLQVRKDKIIIQHDDGSKESYELYDDFPANQKGFLRSIPKVKAGQRVPKGGLLATSNYTDGDGVVAQGVNLRTAYLNMRGMNFEDAVVVSESAARNKLVDERMLHTKVENAKNVKNSLKEYLAAYPGKFNRDQLAKVGPDGMVKKGAVLHKGDPLILGVEETPPSPDSANRRMLRDVSRVWEHDYPGVVTDSVSGRRIKSVYARANVPMEVGDKISNRYGGKGVVAAILPDSEMPTDKKGNPFEMIMSPLGVVSRTNPAQLVETLYGKIAAKQGKPVGMPSFTEDDMAARVGSDLKRAGLTDTEDLVDPVSGATIPKTLTGVTHYYKLSHIAESKVGARGTGAYTSDEAPASGGREGSKRLGSLEIGALVGHGAWNVLDDARRIRGQANQEFWRDLKLGKTPVMPGAPLVSEKFLAHMVAAGASVRKAKDGWHILGMTNQDVRRLSERRKVEASDTFAAGTYRPIKGGLFDPELFGTDGSQWGYIDLPEPLPNPVMQDSLRRALNLTDKDFDAVVAGKKELPGYGKGVKAIREALEKLNVDAELKKVETEMKRATGQGRQKAVTRYRALAAIKRAGAKPADFIMDRIPVIPPKYRPITISEGVIAIPDSNILYKKLMDDASDLREASGKLGDEDIAEARGRLYDDYKTLVGMKDPDDNTLKKKQVGGLLKWVFGKGAPKRGAFQRRVMGFSADLTARGTITPNPSLKLNEIGLPEEQAWNLYEPFITRRLIREGYKALDAVQLVADRHPSAKLALERVVKERPIMATRAPALHKYSIMGFWPVLTKGKTLQVSPSIVEPYNADFDGNCCDYDTEILIRLSKSAFDTIESGWSITDNGLEWVPVPEEEVKTMLGEDSVVSTSVGHEYAFLRIGDFPRVGTPAKDSNGANVYPVPAGVEVASYDHPKGMAVFRPIKHFTVEEACECVRVDTKTQSVIVSSNESLAVFDHESGELVKAAPDVSVGAFVPVLNKSPHKGSEGDFEYGWWLGAFLSDGWVSGGRTVGYAKREEAKRDAFVRIAREHLHENFVVHAYEQAGGDNKYSDSVKLHLNGPDLAAVVTELELVDEEGTGSRQAIRKRLPIDLMTTLSEDCLWGVLAGLLDGDGSIVKNTHSKNPRYTFRLSTSSPELRDSAVRLGYFLGVRTSVTTTPPRNKSREAYTICFSTVDMREKSGGRIRFIGERESALYKEFMSTEVKSKDRIPLTQDERSGLLKVCRLLGFNAMYASVQPRKEHPSVCIPHARELVETVDGNSSLLDAFGESEFQALKKRVECSDVRWEEISGVSPVGEREVFDFDVEGTKVFTAGNGLIIWDTMQFHVPVASSAVRDVVEKMMPERNLKDVRNFRAHYTPIREYLMGLNIATQAPKGQAVKVFKTLAEAKRAFAKGELEATTPIRILETRRS